MQPQTAPAPGPSQALAVPPPEPNDPMLAPKPAPADSQPVKASPAPASAVGKHTELSQVKLDKQQAPVAQEGSNVTKAIVATVVIVLGLALMAVYAYMKQKS